MLMLFLKDVLKKLCVGKETDNKFHSMCLYLFKSRAFVNATTQPGPNETNSNNPE